MFKRNNTPKPDVTFEEQVKNALKWIANIPKSLFESKLSHNTGTKVLSLAMAVLFWFFVMDQVDPEISRIIESVPVQLINTQELDQSSLKIMNQTDYFVNVEVTGRRNNVLGLNSKSIYLWADMRTVRSGVNNVFINSTINSESVNIKTIMPKEIVLTVDRVVSLPKPVQILFSDDFQEDLYQEKLEVKPIEIKVSGPESLVNSVSYLGGTISVNALTAEHTRDVSLVPYSFDGEVVNGVTLDMNYATLSLTVGKNREVTIVPDVTGDPAEGYRIVGVKVTPENVVLSGDIAIIETIQSIMTEAIVLEGDEMNSFILDEKLVLPAGVKTNGLTDGNVRVEVVIEEIQTKEFTFDVNKVPVMNLETTLITDLQDNEGSILVRISDVSSIVSELSINDIQLDFNFASVTEPGNYRIKINLANEAAYDLVEIEPAYVDVNVLNKEETTTNP